MTFSAERFWRRVRRSEGDGCWIWIGARRQGGYGFLRVNGSQTRAHRVAYELEKGPIPTGLNVLHSCDNPPCVRPDHLRVGDQRANIGDAVERKRHFSPFKAQEQKGEANRNARYSDEFIREIRRRAASGETQGMIGRAMGVHRAYVSLVVNRKIWSHLPD